MLPLIDRAAALLHRLGRSAVPVAELVRMLREGGAAVSEPVLLRALAAEPERFRLVEPARALRGIAEGAAGGAARGARFGAVARPAAGDRSTSDDGARTIAAWAASTWVVAASPLPRPELPEAQRPALRRLAATVGRLGWCLDTTSASDVARWFGMLVEEERFRRGLAPATRATETAAAPASRLSGGGAEPSATPRRRRSPRARGRATRTPRAAGPARA